MDSNGIPVSEHVLALVARLYSGAAVPRAPGPPPTPPASMDVPPLALGGDSLVVVRELLMTAERQAVDALLDRLPFGIMAVDVACRCEYANRVAREALEAGDYLCFDGGIVRAATERDTRALATWAASAVRTPYAVPDSASVLIRRRSGRPVRVMAMPLQVNGRTLIVLLLPDPERSRVLRRLLVRLFGLTGTEADVAVLMLEGLGLDDVARERGITLSTARTHWQSGALKVAGGGDDCFMSILQRALLLAAPTKS